MDRRWFLMAVPPLALLAVPASGSASEFLVDGDSAGAAIRPLHGVNGGPLAAGGLLDLTARWKEAGFPVARLHDCHWPNPDVVDVQAIFPNPLADPARPENYDFERTDEYLKAVIDTGAAVVYRLGESIEHQKAKRRVRVPKDADKWAATCAGIVRHYTEGWAKGFKYPIRYWEIWNEPDNRPACWTGTDEDYFRLYSTTAKALRSEFPKLEIGGPGLGNSGALTGDAFEPTGFAKAFLERCTKDAAPLDFLSWHGYTADPGELIRRAKGIRALLDRSGFPKAESHLNEWNYLPDGKWDGMSSKDALTRQKWHARINGEEGAAFVTAFLILSQDAPVDVACFFTAEAPGMGLFSPHGVPSRAFQSFRAFHRLAGHRHLKTSNAGDEGVALMAGIAPDKASVAVLMTRYTGTGRSVSLKLANPPFAGPFHYEEFGIDEKREFAKVGSGEIAKCELKVELNPSAIRLIRFCKK